MKVYVEIDGKAVLLDPSDLPIAIFLDDEDKKCLKKMGKDENRFYAAPGDIETDDLKAFMKRAKKAFK